MSIIGVYKAQFAFSANSSQELSVEEGDLLYLFDKGDDGWWTCKKRVAGAANEEPTGLVPHNFVAVAQPQGSASALYNYEAQTTEEISFNEGAVFDVFAQDGDWVLAGTQGKFGFVPANYIRTAESAPPPLPKKDFAPPPKHVSAVPSATASSISLPQPKASTPTTEVDNDVPPPMPKRPGGSRGGGGPSHSNHSSQSHSSSRGKRAKSFSVHNVDRRSTSDIVVHPEYMSVDDKKWGYKDILSYSTEKKHLFIELQNPRSSLDFRTETRDIAEQILAAIAAMAGAHRGGGGLNEVFVAAKSAGHKSARVMIDFVAANGREVTVKEGELIFILDQSDKQWWRVRNHAGAEGMLPSHIIELEEEKSKGIWPFKKSSKKDKDQEISRERSVRKDYSERGDERGESRDDGRESSYREHDRQGSRDDRNAKKGDSLAPHRSNSKRKPDQRKIRTWTDRSKSFRVEAALLGCADNKIHLHKQNGVKIAVPANKLSAADLEYVEGVTGISFSEDKPLVDRIDSNKKSARDSSSRDHNSREHLKDNNRSSRGASSSHKSELSPNGFDWFDFFLGCGIDPQTCQRYAVNFSRDRMDEASIPSLTPQILRNLGLKEGDILRVTKKVREKFPSDEDAWVRRDPPAKSPTPDAANLRASQSPTPQATAAASPQSVLQPQQTAAAQRALSQPVSSQPTGALADLLGFTTIEPTPQPQAQQQQRALQAQVTAQQQDDLLARQRALREAQDKLQDQKHEAERKMLEAQRTAQSNQERMILEQQANLQKQQIELLKRQQDELRKQQDDYIQVQRTGQSIRASLGPFATGIAQQSTGNFGNFGPSAAATLGQTNVATPPGTLDPFAPINKFVPVVQNQNTGGPFGQQTTGGPFGQQTTGGPFGQQTTGGPFGQQTTGGPFGQMTTGGPFPQPANSGFSGSQPFVPIQHKPAQQAQPFQSQSTGLFGVQSQAGQFGQPQQQQPPFSAQATGPFAPTQQNTAGSFGAQPNDFGTAPAQPFGSQTTGGGGVFNMQQQQTGPFGAPNVPAQSFVPQQSGPFQTQQHTGNQNYGAPAVNQTKNDPFGEIFRQYTGKQTQPTLSQVSTGNVFQPQQQPFQSAQQQGFQPQQPVQAQNYQQPFQQQQQQQQFSQQQAFQAAPPQGQAFQQQPFSGAPVQAQSFQQQQQPQPQQTQQYQAPQRTGGFQPQSQFGQQLQNQPLQSQPTGFGFGNQPQGANYNQASAANPFGF